MEDYKKYLLIILFIGSILRIYAAINAPITNTDELLYMDIAVGTTSSAWERLSTLFHGPLYFYLVDFSFRLFGTSYLSARMVPLIFSILSIPLIYIIGSTLYDRRIGLYASFIFAVSNVGTIFGTMAIFDPIVSTFILLTMALLILYAKNNRNLYLGGFFASLALAINTKLIALYFLPALALLFIFQKKKPAFRTSALLILFFLFLLLPIPTYNYLLYNSKGLADFHITSLLRPETSLSWFREAKIITAESKWYEMKDAASNASKLSESLLKNCSIPLLLLASIGTLELLARRKQNDFVVLAWMFIPLLMFLLYIFHDYYLIHLVPPLSLLAASAIPRLQGRFNARNQQLALAGILFLVLAGESLLTFTAAKGIDPTYQLHAYIQTLPANRTVITGDAVWGGEVAWLGASGNNSGDNGVTSLSVFLQLQKKLANGTGLIQTVYYVECARTSCGTRETNASLIESTQNIGRALIENGILLKEFSDADGVKYRLYESQQLIHPLGKAFIRFMDYRIGHPENSVDIYETRTPAERILDLLAHLSLRINLLLAVAAPCLILWVFLRQALSMQ